MNRHFPGSLLIVSRGVQSDDDVLSVDSRINIHFLEGAVHRAAHCEGGIAVIGTEDISVEQTRFSSSDEMEIGSVGGIDDGVECAASGGAVKDAVIRLSATIGMALVVGVGGVAVHGAGFSGVRTRIIEITHSDRNGIGLDAQNAQRGYQ